jgi:two-component system nitrate/nitrite response regulator NarL
MILLGAIDDDRMLLEGFRAWLNEAEDFSLVNASATVDDFLAATPEADAVMLDLRLADGSDPATNVSRLVEAGYHVCVVSTHHDQIAALNTIQAGAAGYVTKDNDLARLLEALREVAAGRTTHSRELAFTLMQDQRPERPQLSDQQRHLLVLLSSGLTLETSARRIGVQPGTAKKYLDRIKEKYHQAGRPARTKLELYERAREDGLC